MSIKEKCETLRNGVLKVIVDNFDYFRENKSHLAWALMNFDLIHRASRLAYDACQDNANDLYRKIADGLSEEDENLFSDAWDITQMESEGGNYLAGYTVAEEHVRPDIREKILALTTDPLIAKGISDYKAIGNKKTNESSIRRKK